MKRVRRIAGVLLVWSVALVGCGGGEEETSPTLTPTPTTVDSQASGNVGGQAVGAPHQVLTLEDCAEVSLTLMKLASDVLDGLAHVDVNPDDALAALEGLADRAPSEPKAALRIMAATYADAIEALSAVDFRVAAGGFPSPATQAELTAAADRLRTPEMAAAEYEASTWIDAECDR